MNILKLILFALLVLLSISTGIVKLIELPEEMVLFYNAGFTKTWILIFGVIQALGGLLLLLPKSRKIGALIMIITFTIATCVVFMNNMIAFGLVSILFIALATLPFISKITLPKNIRA